MSICCYLPWLKVGAVATVVEHHLQLSKLIVGSFSVPFKAALCGQWSSQGLSNWEPAGHMGSLRD